jgi:hypothetical protein
MSTKAARHGHTNVAVDVAPCAIPGGAAATLVAGHAVRSKLHALKCSVTDWHPRLNKVRNHDSVAASAAKLAGPPKRC